MDARNAPCHVAGSSRRPPLPRSTPRPPSPLSGISKPVPGSISVRLTSVLSFALLPSWASVWSVKEAALSRVRNPAGGRAGRATAAAPDGGNPRVPRRPETGAAVRGHPRRNGGCKEGNGGPCERQRLTLQRLSGARRQTPQEPVAPAPCRLLAQRGASAPPPSGQLPAGAPTTSTARLYHPSIGRRKPAFSTREPEGAGGSGFRRAADSPARVLDARPASRCAGSAARPSEPTPQRSTAGRAASRRDLRRAMRPLSVAGPPCWPFPVNRGASSGSGAPGMPCDPPVGGESRLG